MYDTLLFLHLLGAFVTFVTLAFFVAWVLGVPPSRGGFRVADAAWNVSGALLLIFGVWLALYIDGYELWDGWILGALGLLIAASAFGARARTEVLAQLDSGVVASLSRWEWLRVASIVAILVLMVWKPGA